MADSNFIVKNGLVVNGSFVANSTQVSLGSNVNINTISISVGNSSVNVSINSTSFSGSSDTVGGNTATTLRSYSDTTAATAYSNATSYALSVAGTSYSNATSYALSVAGTSYSNAVTFVGTNSLRAANSTNGFSINGLAATATLATKASTLSQSGGNGTAMTFNWSGQSGQPSWLWGSNDGANIYVYNPSNFNVNYASSAGTATNLSGGSVSATSGTFTGTVTLTGDGTNYIRMENSSGGYLQFKDNKDPDAGIYTYSLGMDGGRFYFYMNSTSNDFQLGYIKAYINQNGNIVAGGQTYDNGAGIIAGNGFASKAGYTGAYGNIFNVYWNGSQARLYIDDSDQGTIETSSISYNNIGSYSLFYSISYFNNDQIYSGASFGLSGSWRVMGNGTIPSGEESSVYIFLLKRVY